MTDLRFPVVITEGGQADDNFQGSLSSPNRMIWVVFSLLRKSVREAKSSTDHPDDIKCQAALAIILSVVAVETFLNAYFRMVVEEEPFKAHKNKVLKEARNKSIHHKLRAWPSLVFGERALINEPIRREFSRIVKTRNRIVHFDYTWHTITVDPTVIISGLADTAFFDNLSSNDAEGALSCAEEIVSQVCRLRGIPESEIPNALHAFTGKVPL